MRQFAAILVLLLSACAGTNFKWEDARKLQVGMSEQEVTSIMGRPYLVRAADDKQVWVWSYANGFTGASQVVSVEMRDGKVIKTPPLPESFK